MPGHGGTAIKKIFVQAMIINNVVRNHILIPKLSQNLKSCSLQFEFPYEYGHDWKDNRDTF